MSGYASWVLEAALGERSWLNTNAARKRGVGILLARKYARLVTAHGSLYENKVIWIKLEEVEGGNIGLVCIYTPNIPTKRRHLWLIMIVALPKDCEWYLRGDFNMTGRLEDKSNDCGRVISNLERFTWNELLNAFHVNNMFVHQGARGSHGTMDNKGKQGD